MGLPQPPKPTPPNRPTNAAHDLANGISTVVGAPMQAVNLLNEGFATATNVVAQALPSFPAATLGSLTVGAPHAHPLHPPSGPPPVPPTPLPPIGPITLGCCVQVLIGGMPAARCGDLGFNPTCCGLPPIFEVFTGSSKVFIGGARAARMLDMTFHCKIPTGDPSQRAARTAAQTAMKVAMAGMVAGGMAAQALSAAGDAVEAVEADDSAMSAALGMSSAMMSAQLAMDAAALAAGMAMGKDPCVPPGTPGTITLGVPNVLIGGFPMPSWMDIAKGFAKVVKGLRGRARSRAGRGRSGQNH